jgi:hypothetical protein
MMNRKIYSLIVGLCFNLSSFAQSSPQKAFKWFPAIKVNGKFKMDTLRQKYPVAYAIETEGSVYLYGRGSKYPTPTTYFSEQHTYVSKGGLLMTSSKQNEGYYQAIYMFKKISDTEVLLTIMKHGEPEKTTYIRSAKATTYTPGE